LSRHVSIALTPAARRAIRLWRAILVALLLDEDKFARSFASFEEHVDATDVGEFDASLEGVGVLIYDEAAPTPQAQDYRGSIVGGGACSLVPLAFEDDSSYQNTAEFIGAIIVVIIMRRLGYKDIRVKLRGDSMTALVWAHEESFRSDLIHNAAIVFVLLLIHTGAEVVGHEHIPGEANWRCDALSRPSHNEKSHEELGLGGITFFELGEDPVAQEIVQLCNPALAVDTEESFLRFWKRAKAAIEKI
jgi:hypothetical protein